jgi:excisionase family DNA binding protein
MENNSNPDKSGKVVRSNKQFRPLVSPVEVAEMAGVHPATVRSWADSGKLTAKKLSPRVIRFDADEVDQFLGKGAGA